ncbi:MAG: TIM barrel protein [Pseudomonadales bacterium]|nr:TIM barrel protein [Pseudomonadales bacterium]
MSDPYWALAAGCVPDALPWDIPRIANAAGFSSCGMWIDPNTTWDNKALAKTKSALQETEIRLIDVEALWLAGGHKATDSHKMAIEAGLELGAKNVLVVSVHDDYEASVEQFHELCELGGEDIRINLEFGEFTHIRSLAAASKFINAVDHKATGILVDLMHLNRAGEALPELEDQVFSYVQACDYWQSSKTMTGDAYIEAAVDSRCNLGEGEASLIDIQTVCRSKLDVSLEIRSRALREKFPDPVARAKQIHSVCLRSAFL